MLEFLILNNRFEAASKFYDTSSRNYKEELIGLYSKGKRAEFIKLFTLLRKEEKLEFYLRVYFLIYNIHPNLKAKGSIPEDQLNAFRQFLDNKGADLAKTNEFLEFYALPFVKKPLEHASFKSLFKKEWVNNLTQKLHIFLEEEDRRMKESVQKLTNSSKQEIEGKKLRSPLSPQFNDPNQQISQSNQKQLQQNKRLFEEIQLYKVKFASLEKNNQALIESFNSHLMQSQNKWFQITKELTNNAKTLIQLISRSNTGLINDRKFQRIKKRTEKFEKIVRKELDELMNQSQDLSVFDKPSVNEISCSASYTPNISQRNATTFVSIDQFVPTNYMTLIRDFKRMEDEQKIKVLQGFSWRIIKSKNKWIRRQTIVGLIVNDVLGLMNGDIQQLLFNQNLMFYVIKLFLYISEDSYGSKVLFRNGGLYKQIVDLIPSVLKSKNYICLGVLLEILENIWHNKQILLELINLNIIDICLNLLLEDPDVISSDQLLESISTLLLNSAAQKEGLDAFEAQINVFYSICQAFKQANDSNRNLLGAIIYCLLGRKVLWKLAHESKLPNFIDHLISIDFRSNKQQLVLIREKLQVFQADKAISGDYLDESIDSNLQEQIFERNEEELADLQQYINGHEILNTKYFLKNKQAEKQIEEINKIMDQFSSKKDEESKDQLEQQNKETSRFEPKDKDPKLQKQQRSNVKFPQIKRKRDGSQSKIVEPSEKEPKQYYSYKSPNFKQQSKEQSKNAYSMHVDPFARNRQLVAQKQKISNSFEIQHSQPEQKRIVRTQTKPSEKAQLDKNHQKKELDKNKPQRRSAEKPQYRIKKSSSVEKGLGNMNKKIEPSYETNKNNSNVDYKSIQGIKSPPQKRTREEVLRQLNQQLKAEKKNDGQQRKMSKNSPVVDGYLPQRENTHIKKNNFVTTEEDTKAFASRPKIRRTPPQEDQ